MYYDSAYAYRSKFEPLRLFETQDAALAHDIKFANDRIIMLASPTAFADFANCECSDPFAEAVKFIVEAREEIRSQTSFKEWQARNSAAAAQQDHIIAAEDECETGIALTQAINGTLAEDAADPALKAAEYPRAAHGPRHSP